jgi:membrane protein YdbS with pleckstrin-like domain
MALDQPALVDPADDLLIHPSQAINYGAYVLASLQMVGCALAFAVLRAHWKLSPAILAVPLVAILARATLVWLRTACLSYHVAKDRLTWRAGLLSRTTQSLELCRIADVTMRQPFLQRLFGVGSLIVQSADANHRTVLIEGVRAPDQVRDWLTDRVQANRSDRGLREIQVDSL